jgi:type IV pilus assembly protein PilM
MMIGQAVNLTPEKTVSLIKDLFQAANITTNHGTLSIPLKSSLVINVEVPDIGRGEVEKMIPIEARKYIPVPISEVLIDWWAIPQKINDDVDNYSSNPQITHDKGGKVEALVVAIHKDTIAQYQSIAHDLNLLPDFFEIETFSAIRSCVSTDLNAKALIDLGASTTKMTIVDYGVVRESHTINKGAQDITTAISHSLGVSFGKAEEIKRKVGLLERFGEQELGSTISPILDYIFSEINNVMIKFQEKHNRPIDKVVLIGGGALLKGVVDLARKSVDVPVVVGEPFNKVETPAFLEEVLREAGPGFAVAVGLGLRELKG